MSHLSLPRIHFKGFFVVNPGTANNDDVVPPPIVNGALVKVIADSDDASFESEMGRRSPYFRGGWNYYGDNEFYFDEVTVTSVELADGKRIVSPADDRIIGACVGMNDAVMVDINSAGNIHGIYGAQIFGDEFVIQGDGFLCRGQPNPSHVRWYNFARNSSLTGAAKMSGIFQTSIPKNEKFTLVAGKSPSLQDMNKALEKTKGLIVRFCLYLVKRSIDTRLPQAVKALEDAFASGKKLDNPAIGCVVGSIGPWQEGDLESVTMGRLLVYPDRKDSQRLGPAIAVVDKSRQVISLDLANSFPEKDESRQKTDWGDVTLLLIADGKRSHIGPVTYDKTEYETTAGVVDVPYKPEIDEALNTGLLALHSSLKANEHQPDPLADILLLETPYMIDTDDRSIYMHKGESRGLTIHALRCGLPDAKPVVLDVKCDTDTGIIGGNMILAGFKMVIDDAVKLQGDQFVSIAPGKPQTFFIEAVNPGSAMLFFRTPEQAGVEPNPQKDPYLHVRVLPNDRFDHISDEELKEKEKGFNIVYDEVLRYYQLMHPAMSKVFNLSNGDNWTAKRAKIVLKRIDPSLHSRYAYMPRTRDLPEGRRKLLERFCTLVIKKELG